MNVCFHFRHTGKGTEDIIVDDNITKAVAASMVIELKLYAQQSHAYEKKERLKFGSLSPEVVALHALQADKIARISRTQEIDAALWKDNPPEGWDILEEAELTPLSIFPAFIAIFLQSFVKSSNECLSIFAVLNSLTSMVVSALYCLPGQIRLCEALLNFGIKERCLITNQAGLTSTSDRACGYQKFEAKTKQLPVNPNYVEYMDVKPLRVQIEALLAEILANPPSDPDAFLYKIEILAAQIDNLNRLLGKEIGGNKLMQDLISGLLLVITIPVSYNELLEMQDRGYHLFRECLLEKACSSFGLPGNDNDSFEQKCKQLDLSRVEQSFMVYLNHALTNAMDSMIAGALAVQEGGR